VAGLVPATHVFAVHSTDGQKAWMAGPSPAKGTSIQTTARTTGFDSPDSPAVGERGYPSSPSAVLPNGNPVERPVKAVGDYVAQNVPFERLSVV
jgi:hypothetical protein